MEIQWRCGQSKQIISTTRLSLPVVPRYHEWLEENKYTSHPSYSDALMQSIKYFGRLNYSNSDIRLANIYIKLVTTLANGNAPVH